MPFNAWFTLIVAALIIGVTALALIRVIIDLRHVTKTLATIVVGGRAIALQTSTVPTALTSVNGSLKPVRDFTEQI
ncbi:MAG: hypothetical protein H0W01_14710 [Pseudonocardiales bacterium]|nr:hypothetical protein [Pseudonocardiales bacterium]